MANAPTALPAPKAQATPATVAPTPAAAVTAPASAPAVVTKAAAPTPTTPPDAPVVAPGAAPANVAKAPALASPGAPANPDAKPVQAYYELPFPVRKDLPAIKISIHVYAVDPAQRFIVVNNVHQGEGDSIEGGVTVREIRPTDIVLEFQGKIFSVPRTGI